MATDFDLVNALKRAAENLLGRTLTTSEADDLIRKFNAAEGTAREKSREALRKTTGLSEQQIRVKAAASDNTDRVITDLQRTVDDWKPKK